MSRRSQAMAEGTQKFTWSIHEVEGRYRARCENHPGIEGWGQSEQVALNDAREKITVASEKADLGTDPR